MSNKPLQYKATIIKKDKHALNIVLGLILLSPISKSIKKYIITALESFIQHLEDGEAKKDSRNSSLPPSSDIEPQNKKNKGEEQTKPKQGGQEGHKGATANTDSKPDKVINLTPDRDRLENDPAWEKVKSIKRRVVDAKISTETIDYVVDTYRNVETGETVTGEFPKGVNAPFQYGPELISLILQIRDRHNSPYANIADFIKENLGIDISEGTICDIVRRLESSPVLDAFEEAAKKDILNAPTVNADETSMSLNGKNVWVHLLTTPLFVFLFIHAKRGREAMEKCGLIGQLKGYLVHDCWAAYFFFKNVVHCLCNAHILRELAAASEMGQKWADLLSEHLLDIEELTKCYGGMLPLHLQCWAREKYRKIIALGYESTGGKILARPPGKKGKRGRMAKPKYRNLLERLDAREDAVLRFMIDRNIPFTNNDAERPVRQLKLHDKISGCFRSLIFGIGYCRMRGYLESCKKNGISSIAAIKMLVNGETPSFILKWLAA
jgi:transposase